MADAAGETKVDAAAADAAAADAATVESKVDAAAAAAADAAGSSADPAAAAGSSAAADAGSSAAGSSVVEAERRRLSDVVQARLEKLDLRRNILQLKYDGLKNFNDGLQIAVIVGSTLLTLLETCKAQLQDDVDGASAGWRHGLALLPVFMSASIATVAAVRKFRKFQERMENMIRAIDVCVDVMFMLKKTQETIRSAATAGELAAVQRSYSEKIYECYCKAQESVERCLKYSDLAAHLPAFHALTLDLQRTEADFQARSLAIDIPGGVARLADRTRLGSPARRMGGDAPGMVCRVM